MDTYGINPVNFKSLSTFMHRGPPTAGTAILKRLRFRLTLPLKNLLRGACRQFLDVPTRSQPHPMLPKATSPQLLPRCTTQGANKCEASTRFAQPAFGAANSHVMAAPFSQLLNFELGGPGGAGDGGKIDPNFPNFEVTRGERSLHRRRRSRSSRHQQDSQASTQQPAGTAWNPKPSVSWP